MKAQRTLKRPTWTFEVPKRSKYHANERLKCQNVTYNAKWKANMAKRSKYHAKCEVTMPKCSKHHAKWKVLVPNCCIYKANGARKESKKTQNLRQKNTKNYSTPLHNRHFPPPISLLRMSIDCLRVSFLHAALFWTHVQELIYVTQIECMR